MERVERKCTTMEKWKKIAPAAIFKRFCKQQQQQRQSENVKIKPERESECRPTPIPTPPCRPHSEKPKQRQSCHPTKKKRWGEERREKKIITECMHAKWEQAGGQGRTGTGSSSRNNRPPGGAPTTTSPPLFLMRKKEWNGGRWRRATAVKVCASKSPPKKLGQLFHQVREGERERQREWVGIEKVGSGSESKNESERWEPSAFVSITCLVSRLCLCKFA